MSATIALAGNPNSGKTTLFNELTGSAQHVGNWPGVTVEKKSGKLKGYKDVEIVDLPGIYSLSPYTLEEVVARNYLMDEKPDVIVNVVDASNLERNLYLTTQLLELDIPVVVALNMIDMVERNGDVINIEKLSKKLGCPVIPTSAVQNQAHEDKVRKGHHKHYLHGHKLHNTLISRMRGLDAVAGSSVALAEEGKHSHQFATFQRDVEDTVQSIQSVIDSKATKAPKRWLSIKLFESDEKVLESESFDQSVLDRVAKLRRELETKLDDDAESILTNERYEHIGRILDGIYTKKNKNKLSFSDKIDKVVTNKWLALPIFFGLMWFVYWVSISTLGDYFIGWVESLFEWIGGGVSTLLISLGTADWLHSLVVDGIIGGVGGVLVFVPQLMILFFFISLLEDCGYMARVAFIMDRIFRKFGLSGKSFIPMLIGTGCSIPGIMASRTIENEKDRKMTIMLTPFIPCGAKLPVFAMFIAMLFSKQSWMGPLMYFLGITMVIVSGIILKRTKRFRGEPAPFVMELPEYRVPRGKGVLIHMWEKGKSFMIKAGTIILVAAVAIWFLQCFSFRFEYLGGEHIENSILAGIGGVFRYLFIPLGFGNSWAAGVASITGLAAKEVVVATFSVVGAATDIVFSQVSAFSFMVFTLLAAPCFAAIGAMRREFGNWRWTFFALLYQTGLAYGLSLLIFQVGRLIFNGTSAMDPVVLDPSAMEEMAEGAVIQGDIVLIIFGVLLALALIIGLWNVVQNAKHRKKMNQEGKKMVA